MSCQLPCHKLGIATATLYSVKRNLQLEVVIGSLGNIDITCAVEAQEALKPRQCFKGHQRIGEAHLGVEFRFRAVSVQDATSL